MDYEDELLKEARKAFRKYPSNRCEIIDLYQLAMSEIEEGESMAHEYELFMGRLNEI